MRRVVIILAGIFIGLAAPAVTAQTLYNAPGDTSGASRGPLNLRELLRRPEPKKETGQPNKLLYANPDGRNASAAFETRLAALNQWRDQRDAQAQADHARALNEMIHYDSKLAAMGNVSGAPGIPAATGGLPVQPTGPMIYRKKDTDKIQKPRTLFNSVR